MSDVFSGVMTLPPEVWLSALGIVLTKRLLVPLLAIFLPEKQARRAERVLRIQRGRPDAKLEKYAQEPGTTASKCGAYSRKAETNTSPGDFVRSY
ncbi:MAG: hypothetical protein JO287_14895 [Pseudonocardiales bacterium]|nr:hypothetical protein [Pseudonocardiales bacterium]